MAVIKPNRTRENNKCSEEMEKLEFLYIPVGNVKLYSCSLETNKHRIYHMNKQFHFWEYTQMKRKQRFNSIIHNSPKVEPTQMPTHG